MKFLYHANCNDGSGAALVAWMRYGYANHDYIPVQYGSPPPAGLDGETVYILDFSYPRDVLIDLAKICQMIVVIDHHKTAQADLADPFPPVHDGHRLCPVETHFDMEESGAVLAYRYFFGFDPPPLLEHIQDRDLWRFELVGTKAICAALQTIPDWKDWEQYLYDVAPLEIRGQGIVDFLAIQADKISETKPVEWPVTGDVVPVYNLPGFLISDTLHRALEKYWEAPYAVAWFDIPGKRVYSLRSKAGSNVDVSAIAARFGGGGHKHAAGFTVEVPDGGSR